MRYEDKAALYWPRIVPDLEIQPWRRGDLVTSFARALVLAAAVFHATWNLFAKRVEDRGAPFVWLFGALSAIIYAPLAVVVVLYERPHFGPAEILFMCGSGVLHLGYFLLLQRGYATGDLSLIYPLSRGTGPLLSTAAAIALLGERGLPPSRSAASS